MTLRRLIAPTFSLKDAQPGQDDGQSTLVTHRVEKSQRLLQMLLGGLVLTQQDSDSPQVGQGAQPL
jgi:hypothetical protein